MLSVLDILDGFRQVLLRGNNVNNIQSWRTGHWPPEPTIYDVPDLSPGLCILQHTAYQSGKEGKVSNVFICTISCCIIVILQRRGVWILISSLLLSTFMRVERHFDCLLRYQAQNGNSDSSNPIIFSIVLHSMCWMKWTPRDLLKKWSCLSNMHLPNASSTSEGTAHSALAVVRQ